MLITLEGLFFILTQKSTTVVVNIPTVYYIIVETFIHPTHFYVSRIYLLH